MDHGVAPRRKRTFVTATKEPVTREVGYVILASGGYETAHEIVFAESGDMIFLGVRTVTVENIGHRFVAQTTIVA
jgi:hypothetical protein